MARLPVLKREKNLTKEHDAVKFSLLISLHFELMIYTQESISGVTYMDHFNFEKRYRDVYECDPFYWHPLHLPEHCAEIYEKVLRSKISSTVPLRILKKKEQFLFSYEDFSSEDNPISYEIEPIDKSYEYDVKSLPPYEQMLEYLRRDIIKDPKAPIMGVLPNLGPVAVYRQPVSRKSEYMIKRMAKAYSKSRQDGYDNAESYYGRIDVKPENNNKHSDKIDLKDPKIKRFVIKTKQGGTVTIKKYVE